MMEFQARLKRIEQDYETQKILITFEAETNGHGVANFVNSIKEFVLKVTVDKYRLKRSKDANALMWVCLDKIAEKIHSDRWSVYLKMLKDYGKFTYICVKPNVVEAVKKQWRECEEVGRVNINGQDSVQLLCYFGSSTYDTKEFSRLLDGIINEMRELGIETPTSKEMEVALEKWEKYSSV